MNQLEDLSREDLLKIMARDRAVKSELAGRIGALTGENVELLGIIQEYERENHELREQLAVPAADE